MEIIRKIIKNLKLKYHTCWRHSTCIDSYTNSAGNNTSHATWTTTKYKCNICGKIWDVD